VKANTSIEDINSIPDIGHIRTPQ